MLNIWELWNNYSHIFSPFVYLIGGLLVGFIIQGIIVRKLAHWARVSAWKWDDVCIDAIGRMPVIWAMCGGMYLSRFQSDFSTDMASFYDKTLITLMLFTVTIVCSRIAGGLMERVPNERLPVTSLFVNGARFLVYIVGVIIILQNLNIEITPMITALGIGGLAVALALEETLNNLFSGVQIIASQLVRPGDYVELSDGKAGYVTDIKARNTTIKSFPDNNRIIVPNSVLASSTITNYSLPERNMWIQIPVGVAYDSDLEEVERITLEVASDIAGTITGAGSDNAPVFMYDSFADSSINFTVRIFIHEFKHQFLVKHSFIKALHKRYSAENIEIPFPIRTVYHKNAAPAAVTSDQQT